MKPLNHLQKGKFNIFNVTMLAICWSFTLRLRQCYFTNFILVETAKHLLGELAHIQTVNAQLWRI